MPPVAESITGGAWGKGEDTTIRSDGHQVSERCDYARTNASGNPVSFVRLYAGSTPRWGIDAIVTHRWELRLAEKAFAEVLGLPNPLPNDDRRIVEMLNRGYKLFGVSSGIQQTWQLVRDFESAAAEQARGIAGRSR